MGTARRVSRASGQTEHLYGETRYAAGTWDQRRRVIIKAEVVRHPGREPKDNRKHPDIPVLAGVGVMA